MTKHDEPSDHTKAATYKIRCNRSASGATTYDLIRNKRKVSTGSLPQVRKVMKFLKRRDFQRQKEGVR